MQRIYLDNAATTMPFEEVNKAFTNCNNNYYGNSSSLHRMGLEAEEKLESAREYISNYLGCNRKEIIFTSGGTESTNTAIKSYLEANKHNGNEIITSCVEHMATYSTINNLDKNIYNIKYLTAKSLVIDLNELEENITPKTTLISIIHVNNESGVINPISEISKLVRTKNKKTAIHFDIVQSFGKLDLQNISRYCDFLSVSSHKLHGPKGVGFLYCNKNINFEPLIRGGGQEFNLRSGTVNVPLINAFHIATKKVLTTRKDNLQKVKKLKTHLIKKLKSGNLEYSINFEKNTSPYILSISFKDVKSEVLVHYLESEGIYVSTSSACSSKKGKNRVLKNYNLDYNTIDGTIRISFSMFNTIKEIDIFYESLCKFVPKIKY